MRPTLATSASRISLVGTAQAAGSSTTPTVSTPAGSAPGDRLYIMLHINEADTTSVDNNGATPTTEEGEYQQAPGTSDGYALYYRTLGGSEPASFTFTINPTNRWVAIAWTLRGIHPTSIWDVTPAFGAAETSTNPTCPTATTVADRAWAFAVSGTDGTGNGTYTAGPTGWTQLATENTQQPMSIYYKEISPPGATGDQDFTISLSGTSYNMTIFSVAPGPARPRGFLRLAAA